MKRFIILVLSTFGFIQAGLTDAEKFDLVQRSAPLLKFHPKDDSSLASADWYIPKCSLEVLKENGTKEVLANLGTLTPERLAELLKKNQDKIKGEIFLNPGAGKEPNHKYALKGPGYENGISDQHAYYNFLEISDTYVKISYWFFYPYQGNIDIVPGVNTVIEKLKAGSHEGDWEHINVRWEKVNNAWEIKDVFFGRHGYQKGDLVNRQNVQFVNDQMKSDKKGTHPVVYVAMNSHGTYPKNIFFLSSDVDKTSNKGPQAFMFGKDKQNNWKLEDYNKQAWSPYIFRWGADLTKKLGGSPKTPHGYDSFIKGKRSPATLIVDKKPVLKLEVKNGKSPYFEIERRARIKEIDFRVIGTVPQSIELEVWKRAMLGLGDKKLYGPFKLTPKHIVKDNPLPDENVTDAMPATYQDTLYIKAPKSQTFTLEIEYVE